MTESTALIRLPEYMLEIESLDCSSVAGDHRGSLKARSALSPEVTTATISRKAENDESLDMFATVQMKSSHAEIV